MNVVAWTPAAAALLLALSCCSPTAQSLRLDGCGHRCNRAQCPPACVEPTPDPCGCCQFLCAVAEGESCSRSEPCQAGLACRPTSNGEICTCDEEEKMVCGSNGVTYGSICQFKKETARSNLTMKHWGPCEFHSGEEENNVTEEDELLVVELRRELEELDLDAAGAKAGLLGRLPPELISGPTDTKLQVGKPLALDCEVKGFPIPVITWTFTSRDGRKKLLPSDDEQTAVQLRGGPEHLMVTSWVQIIEARNSDAGFYECRAKNKLGSVSGEAAVSIGHHRHRG